MSVVFHVALYLAAGIGVLAVLLLIVAFVLLRCVGRWDREHRAEHRAMRELMREENYRRQRWGAP